MAPSEYNGRPSGTVPEENVVEAVGLREVRVVIQVRSEQAVIRRKLVIHTGGIEIFRHNLQSGVDELPFVLSGGSGGGMGEHSQLRRCCGVHRHRTYACVWNGRGASTWGARWG